MFLEWDIVTPHYPPQEGGIADYTFVVAQALAQAGDSVSVWCPRVSGETPAAPGVRVHQVFQRFDVSELLRLNRIWAASPKRGRRILLMYHPHGFGWHSLNVPFCMWLLWRGAWNKDRIVLVLHEYGIGFTHWKYQPFAVTHRLMLALALCGAAQIWSPVEAWTKSARLWALGRAVPIEWLPVFANIPLAGDSAQVLKVRSSLLKKGEQLIGHFGTCPESVTSILTRVLPPLLRSRANRKALLIGIGTDRYARALEEAHPDLAGRIQGTGTTSAASVSIQLRACDVLLQPYPDGVNARNSSAMAALVNSVPMITNHGRLSEQFWNELTAIRIVPAGDPAGMIRATEEVLGDPGIRRSMSVAAQSYYQQHFTPEQVVRRLRARELASLE